jgi:hypothetical protein
MCNEELQIYSSLDYMQMKEGETCGPSSRLRISEDFTRFSSQNLKSKDRLESNGVDVRVLLKFI